MPRCNFKEIGELDGYVGVAFNVTPVWLEPIKSVNPVTISGPPSMTYTIISHWKEQDLSRQLARQIQPVLEYINRKPGIIYDDEVLTIFGAYNPNTARLLVTITLAQCVSEELRQTRQPSKGQHNETDDLSQ